MAIINGTAVANVLNGTASDDTINGLGGNDTLNGLAGNDTLDGGTGSDTMAGGTGNDTYVVDSVGDKVTEGSNAGTDTVKASITYTLGANVENLTLTGAAAINGTGNTLNNVIIGNNANNILNGGAGNDTLNGGLGNDTLIGGTGNDILVVNAIGDKVTEAAGGGTDTVESSITFTLNTVALANVENLKLSGASAINGTGNALANVITGNGAANKLDGGAGNDRLDGGLGNDTMIGGAGNDVFVVNAAGDVVTEAAGGGTDTVESSITYSIAALANVENVTLTGTGNTNATGNNGNNVLTGNGGNNVLNGGAGIDTMIGGAGNDTYVVDSRADTIVEAVSGGTDTVLSGIGYSLSLPLQPGLANVENLTLTGTAAIDGFGNALNNILIGNSNENLLDGRDGNDTLLGGGGDDILIGRAGNDVLNGEAGSDILLGLAGNDTLVWDENDDIVNGGTGEDTLAFSGTPQTLELPGMAGTLIQGIEAIDMRNGSADSLLINPDSILDLSWTSDTVRIEGDEGDTIFANEHWTHESIIEIGDNDYAVLTNGDATLHVRGFAGIEFDAPNDAATGSATAALDGGFEDAAYTIHQDDLLEGFSDPDGDMLFVDDLTAGNGTLVDNDDGTWTFTPDENFSGTVDLDYVVQDVFGDGIAASQEFELAGVADEPGLSVLDATGTEDNEIALTINGTLADGSEALSFVISGVPAGAALSAGTDNGDGSWTVTAEEAVDLTITPPADSEDSFDLTVTAVSTDGTSTAESDPQVIHVTVVPEEEELSALEGTAVDGYIVGATVFADTNENGTLDAGEAWTTTGGSGQFSLVGGTGPLVLFGGTDISTGLPFEATLTAPEGFTVITPLTTLIAAIMEDGAVDAATAEGQLEAALGLPDVDLTTFDPIAAALDEDEGNDAAALSVFAAGVQVYNAVALASSLLAGTGEVTGDDATAAVIATIVQAVDGGNGSIDLSSAAEMQALVEDSATLAVVDIGTSADEAGTIIAATNTVIDDAISAPATNLEALTEVAQVSVVVNGDGGAVDTLEAGNVTQAAEDFTGANLDTAVDDAADDVGAVGGAVNGTNDNNTLNGTAGNDVLDGLGGNDTLTGGDGNDLLFGGTGRDNLDGGDGNDQIFGGAGDDFLTGGLGDDLLDGGENPTNQLVDRDTANYEINDSIDGATGVTVNLVTGTASDGLGFTDALVNIERVIGTNFNDVLTGGDPTNFGTNRSEVFEGRGGNDTITGSADAANNSTLATYSRAASGVFINLGSTLVSHGPTDIAAGTAQDGDGGLDTLVNVNRITGSAHEDVIYGSDLAVGNERFQGGAGADYIDGQGGIDYVQYQNSTGAVTVTFFNSTFGTGNAEDGYGFTDTFADIEGVRGSAFNDVLTGSDRNEGLPNGGSVERFEGMAGNDVITGNGGFDRVEHGQSASGVIVNLSNSTVGIGQAIIGANSAFDGFGGVDTLSGIEQVSGSRFNDTFIGSNENNRFDGGLGSDTVTYHAATSGVTVDLSIQQGTGGGGTDTLISIENVTGSSSSDNLTGDSNANRLNGRGGNDLLVGGGGNDILDGGENSSNIRPDADTADYNVTGVATGVTVNLGTGVASEDGFGGTDTLISIERVTGTAFADNLTGGDVHNIGTGVSEQFEGLAGNDVITGGDIADGFTTFALYTNSESGVRVNIGDGNVDLADYGESGILEAGTAWDGFGDIDTLIEINRVRGSAFDDMLFGGSTVTGVERFEGMAGNDYIDGGDGIDILHYSTGTSHGISVTLGADGSGVVLDDGFSVAGQDEFDSIEGVRGTNFNDVLTGSDRDDGIIERFEGMGGNDTITGGLGLDRIEYSQSGSGVNVNLGTNIASDGFGTTDTLSGIEQVTGSRFGDTLIGNSGDNLLNGSGGNDTLIGGAGNDALDGGENISDLLADSDLVRYDVAGILNGVNVNLATGTASNDGFGFADSLSGIERVTGTSFADVLTGGDTANIGTGKSEQFEGLGGADVITGGGIVAGFTTFAMYTSAPTGVRVNIGDASVNLAAFGESGTLAAGTARDGYGTVDTLFEINRVRGSAFADRMFGGDSPGTTNERFEGMAGNDYIDGGAGIDYLHYNSGNPGTGVSVTFSMTGSGTVANDGFGGTDTFLGIEGVRGSNHADNLIGSNRDDGIIERFEGMGGNDTITGNGGIDRIEYGQSENGINVNLALGTALDGWGGVDTLSGIEQVQGSRLNDTITGNSGNNRLDGSEGNDRIAGGAGDDTLIGGLDADTFDWNAGDQGTEGSPAVDTVTDFNMGAGDRLDLRDLLVGENGSNLDQYLDFHSDGSDTFIEVKSAGLSGVMDQVIVLQGVDLTEGSTLSDAAIINNLLSGGSLLADGVV